jgi:uncharacterized protein (TIRG00374 family)
MSAKSVGLSARAKGRLQILAGTLVSLGFLWLAFRGIDWRGSWQTMIHANAWLLLVALGIEVLATAIRAERWRLMFFPHHRHLRRRKFFSIFLIGQVINAATPARLGELARAYLVGEIERVSKAQALWTTVVEKVLDAFTLLLFLAVLSASVALPGWLRDAGWTLSLAIVVVLAGLALAVALRARVTRWIERLNARWPWSKRLRLERFLAVVVESLQLMRRPGLSVGLLGWSILAFLAASVTNWITGLAFGLRLPFAAYLLLLAVLQISAVVPLPTSPGRVGLFHYLCVVSLAIFGIERDVALSYSLVLHVLTYLPMLVGGPLCLWLENYDWGRLSRLLREDRGAEVVPQRDSSLRSE